MTKIYPIRQILLFFLILILFAAPVRTNQASPVIGRLNYQNIVLSPGSDESQRRFNWYSDQQLGWLAYRLQGSDVYRTIPAESRAATGRPGWYVHRASINNLLPSSRYEYMLIGGNGLQSNFYEFRTTNFSDFQFFIVGDIQIGAGDVTADGRSWLNTVTVAAANFPYANKILSMGDQVHQGGSRLAYEALLSPPQLTRLSFAPAVGNHESGTQLFADHYNLPNVSPFGTGATQMNYWFRYGSALFIVLNSNTTNIEMHRNFLETTVSSNEDALWRVVIFHHGPYTEFRAQHYAPKVAIRNTWIPLFDSLGIDIVLNGHCHSYNRTFHLRGGQPVKNQLWLDDGQIRHDPSALLYNTVINPVGTVYFSFNSSTGNRF